MWFAVLLAAVGLVLWTGIALFVGAVGGFVLGSWHAGLRSAPQGDPAAGRRTGPNSREPMKESVGAVLGHADGTQTSIH